MPRQYYKQERYTPRDSVGYHIRLAAKWLTVEFEARFAEKDVNFLQWTILIHLKERLAFTAADLCNSTLHDSGALTRVLDQLEERRLIRRERSRQDRRIVELELTPEGQWMVDALLPLVIDFYNKILTDFTQEEADQLLLLLKKFTATLTLERVGTS